MLLTLASQFGQRHNHSFGNEVPGTQRHPGRRERQKEKGKEEWGTEDGRKGEKRKSGKHRGRKGKGGEEGERKEPKKRRR